MSSDSEDSEESEDEWVESGEEKWWMHSSTNFQAPPYVVDLLWSCDKVYHKQEVGFLFYLQGQLVTWQYNPNPLD